ncbi:hypothetical protein KQ51_00173 [Candidatus Izimaplasma bacterium HR1]|jgi:bacteriorhodopsin|uniref:hypothetical protein n=1 Tax=Candidatus Izimoplasma sp. HR1 TaxID=1541959 RepID=UPI0004F8561E|nr:hypothetical protein KQ51_00173 [Candidatus Izimaplasma bacterium HR1]
MIIFIDQIFYYKLAIFGALMVMAFFEAFFYINDDNLKNKRDFYKVSFIANAIVGASVFIPIYEFDLLAIGLYFVRSFFVGRIFIKLNTKKTKEQARNSYFFTLFKNMMVFVAYNLVFFLTVMLIGVIFTVIKNLMY